VFNWIKKLFKKIKKPISIPKAPRISKDQQIKLLQEKIKVLEEKIRQKAIILTPNQVNRRLKFSDKQIKKITENLPEVITKLINGKKYILVKIKGKIVKKIKYYKKYNITKGKIQEIINKHRITKPPIPESYVYTLTVDSVKTKGKEEYTARAEIRLNELSDKYEKLSEEQIKNLMFNKLPNKSLGEWLYFLKSMKLKPTFNHGKETVKNNQISIFIEYPSGNVIDEIYKL